MSVRYLFFICLLWLLPAATPLHAQTNAQAERLYAEALRAYAQRNYTDAYQSMESALQADRSFINAYSTLGEWYYTAHRFRDALRVFTDGSKNCTNGARLFAKPLAKALMASYYPSSALQTLNAYAPAKMPEDWKQLVANAGFMQTALTHPWEDTIYNMGLRINSPDPEMYPRIAADTQTMYFTRRMNGVDEDFFYAVVDSCGGWFSARNMGAPPNTPDHESAQMISADRHYLFFTRCENRSENGWDMGGCDLFMAYKPGAVWSIPQNFGGTINSPGYEGMPYLSPDNRELFFVSNREGGYGGLDIYVSRFEEGLWQAPRNMGAHINTTGNETAPFLHADNQTLYFSSTGQPGMGGADLYFCKRIDDSVFSAAVNLGYPINTVADENSLSVSADGNTLYFASDRDSMAGNFDIYQMQLPAPLRPQTITFLKGYVYDSLTKERLNYANIYINNLAGKQLLRVQSNRGDASFMIPLATNQTFTYYADRIGYLEMTDTMHFTTQHLGTPEEYNIALLPQGYVKPMSDSSILVIYFPINSSSLSDSDRSAINAALAPWLLEKQLSFLVNGYTDNTGTPIINEQLSYMRSRLVAEQLYTLGIDPLQVQAQGWGEAQPLADNADEVGRGRNRRVELIIRR